MSDTITPSKVDETIEKGMAHARREDWPAAIDDFRRAASLDSESVEARFRLAWALWNRSEEEKPSVADLAVGYGAQLLGFDVVARDRGKKFASHRKLLDESAHWFREVIARDPKHARAHYYVA